MESYASRTIDLKPPRALSPMVTRCLPLGNPLEGWFYALVKYTYMCMYTYVYIYRHVYTYALYCIRRNAKNALPSNPLARWSLY